MTIRRLRGPAAGRNQAVAYGGLVWTVGTAQDTSLDLKGQTRQTLENIEKSLRALGSDKTRLLSAQPDVTVVGTARDGEEAVALARSLKPDVITLDVQMPGMDGLGATERIMAETPCRILMVSGAPDTDLSFRALQAGALEVIAKPQGSPEDVARFGQCVLEELSGAQRIAPAALWERALRVDTTTQGSTRAMGFDTPSKEGSSAGRFIGDQPPGAVGHLGFTGTSLWIDRARQLVVALCTNRTFHGRAEVRIRSFRPRFHDAVVETLGLQR